jgi:hypothetical protein
MSRYLVLLSALAVSSCSGGESAPARSTESDTGTVADVAAETPEACGTNVGETFCDHELMGYVRVGETTGLATETAYGAYKISDALAKSTVKYVYIYGSAYW